MDGKPSESVKQIFLFVLLIYKIVKAYIETFVELFTPTKRKSIKGQNVLITGAGHGLGRELALKIASKGSNLVLVDINQANNETVCAEVRKKYPTIKIVAITADIRSECEVGKLAIRTFNEVGNIDILINNAGIVQCKPFLDLSPQLIERTIQVNVLAHMWTTRYFLPAMIASKRGHIVAISSIAGLIGGKYLSDYCASKFAVVGFMDSLEREIHDQNDNKNIHLTTVCPTCMSTGMFQTFTSRFSWLLPVLSAEQVAGNIVDAIITNKTFAAIPPITLFLHRLSFLIPSKVNHLVQKYLDYGVRPHKIC